MFRGSRVEVPTLLAILAILSCHNPRAANKANFRAAIQAVLDTHSACLTVSMPNDLTDFEGHSQTDLRSEALVSAGLANKQQGGLAPKFETNG
jgi:hypothetical protein